METALIINIQQMITASSFNVLLLDDSFRKNPKLGVFICLLNNYQACTEKCISDIFAKYRVSQKSFSLLNENNVGKI